MNSSSSSSRDSDLLRRFAEGREEAALRSLVEKYTGLVYGVALRRTGQRELAEEISQNVFLALARKAGSLGDRRSLGAWLHRAATLESLRALRQDATRTRHLAMIRDHQEESAQPHADDHLWRELRGQLDELLNRLSAGDREILVRHYIEGLQFSEIASELSLSAAAAQKRSVRALRKLARWFGRRGTVVSAAVLGTVLSRELASAAPAGLAGKISSTVLASGATTSVSTTTSLFAAMTTSKLAFAGAFVLAALVPLGIQIAETQAASSAATARSQPSTAAPRPRRADAARSPFDADEFRKALRSLGENRGVTDERTRRLLRSLYQLDVPELRRAIAVLDEFEDPTNYHEVISAVFARWAELDPEAAIADADKRPLDRWGYHPINSVWLTWAFSDWEAARDWHFGNREQFRKWSYLDWRAEVDGPTAVAHAREIAEKYPRNAEHVVLRALTTWGANAPGPAFAWMDENIVDPARRNRTIGDAIVGLGEHDPKKALSYAHLIENPERLREVRHNVAWSWALLQPGEAADYFEESGAGERWHSSNVRGIAEAISRSEPVRALEVARAIEDPARRDSFYVGILSGARHSDLMLVKEAADAISARGARTNDTLGGFLRHWASRDRAAAAAWVEGLPEGDKKSWAQHVFPRQP